MEKESSNFGKIPRAQHQHHQYGPPGSNNNISSMMEEQIIKPKKLINPVKESTQRMNLHRELLFNQKIGKDVLNQKTELERAMEKMKRRKQEQEVPEITDFQKVLKERAKLIEDNQYFVEKK